MNGKNRVEMRSNSKKYFL